MRTSTSRCPIYHGGVGERDAAIAALEKSVDAYKLPRRMFNLSLLYRDGGRVNDSNEMLKRVLARDPSFPNAREMLLMSLFQNQQCDAVVVEARAGAEIDPNNPIYYYTLGKCLVVLGYDDEAATALRHARGLKPTGRMLQDINATLQEIAQK